MDIFLSIHEKYDQGAGGRGNVLLSPANVQLVSDDFLRQTKELAAERQVGIHMHLVESFYQKEYGIRQWGRRWPTSMI